MANVSVVERSAPRDGLDENPELRLEVDLDSVERSAEAFDAHNVSKH
jgi:hypothetical protein